MKTEQDTPDLAQTELISLASRLRDRRDGSGDMGYLGYIRERCGFGTFCGIPSMPTRRRGTGMDMPSYRGLLLALWRLPSCRAALVCAAAHVAIVCKSSLACLSGAQRCKLGCSRGGEEERRIVPKRDVGVMPSVSNIYASVLYRALNIPCNIEPLITRAITVDVPGRTHTSVTSMPGCHGSCLSSHCFSFFCPLRLLSCTIRKRLAQRRSDDGAAGQTRGEMPSQHAGGAVSHHRRLSDKSLNGYAITERPLHVGSLSVSCWSMSRSKTI